MLIGCSVWATTEIINDDVYYWVARQAIVNELPLLGIKADTAYRHLKVLADIGVIDYIKKGKKDCIRITEKGKSYYVGNKSELDKNTMSEINPKNGKNSEINPSHYVGNKSENNSEINPTYKNTNTNQLKDLSVKELNKKKSAKELLHDFGLTDDDLITDFIFHRKELKAPITKTALNRFASEAKKAGIETSEAIKISVERGWRGFNSSWNWQDSQNNPQKFTTNELAIGGHKQQSHFTPKTQRNIEVGLAWLEEG